MGGGGVVEIEFGITDIRVDQACKISIEVVGLGLRFKRQGPQSA